MTIVNGLAAGQRVTRMEIKGDIQLFQLGPERQIARVVQINDRIRIANLRKTIDHGSLETQILDASRQLRDRRVGILHRQSRETRETTGSFDPSGPLTLRVLVTPSVYEVGGNFSHKEAQKSQKCFLFPVFRVPYCG